MLYQAWIVRNSQSFNPQTWTTFANTETSRALPGAVEFNQPSPFWSNHTRLEGEYDRLLRWA